MRLGNIRAVLVLAVAGSVLAGCTHHPTTTSPSTHTHVGGQQGGPSGGTTLPADAKCVDNLTLGLADNGSVHCLRLGGQVVVGLVDPHLMEYAPIGVSGSALTLQPLPMPFGYFMYKATSRGTAVLTAAQFSCLTSTGTGTCPTMPPWSATIVVR